jgi:hypothetical protein
MAKNAHQIANDLDELAVELEAEAADYRRTAEALRRRAGAVAASPLTEQSAIATPPDAVEYSGTQHTLLAAYRAHGGQAITMDQLVETAASQGHQISKQAAYAANNRMLKRKVVERVAHGRYRERQDVDESLLSEHLNSGNSLPAALPQIPPSSPPVLNGAGVVQAEEGR